MSEEKQQKGTVLSNAGSYNTDAELIPTGEILDDRYKIIEKIGSGGFGCVYKVYDNLAQKEKAIKIIYSLFSSQEDVMSRLRKEINRMNAFNDRTYIVKSYGLHSGKLFNYFDMELLSGGSLRKLIDSSPNEKLSEKDAIDIAKQIIAGMITVHNEGIIHKDLKPDNILLSDNKKVKISDFGISEKVRSSRSRLDETRKEGTREYMSPEQLIGKKVGKEADVWAFGVMFYEMLSGEICFRGETTNEMMFSIERILDVEKNKETREYVQYGKMEPIPNVSDKINDLIKKCLNYNYTERFRNFEEVQDFLNQNKEKQEILIKIKNFLSDANYQLLQNNFAKAREFYSMVRCLDSNNYEAIRGLEKLQTKEAKQNKIKLRNQKERKEKQIAEEQTRKKQIKNFLSDANYQLLQNNFAKAREFYSMVRCLDSNNYEAIRGLEKLQTKEAKQNKIKLRNQKERKEKQIAEEQTRKKQMENQNMVFVKGGSFQMGSNDYVEEQPVHSVTVSDLYIVSERKGINSQFI